MGSYVTSDLRHLRIRGRQRLHAGERVCMDLLSLLLEPHPGCSTLWYNLIGASAVLVPHMSIQCGSAWNDEVLRCADPLGSVGIPQHLFFSTTAAINRREEGSALSSTSNDI